MAFISSADDAPAVLEPTESVHVRANTVTGSDSWKRQLGVWLKDPAWSDTTPRLEVSQPQGCFCKVDSSAIVGLPPGAVFSIICDPNNKRVFKNIKEVTYRKVLSDDGARQEVELHQTATWRFLCFSGTFSTRLRIAQDASNGTLAFQLAEPGFMKSFQGFWKVDAVPFPPSEASTLTSTLSLSVPAASHATTVPSATAPGLPPSSAPQLHGLSETPALVMALSSKAAPSLHSFSLREIERAAQSSAPSFPSVPWYGQRTRVASLCRVVQEVEPGVPVPPFLAGYMRGIAGKTMQDVLSDLQLEAARQRYALPEDCDLQAELRRVGHVSPQEGGDGHRRQSLAWETRHSRRGADSPVAEEAKEHSPRTHMPWVERRQRRGSKSHRRSRLS